VRKSWWVKVGRQVKGRPAIWWRDGRRRPGRESTVQEGVWAWNVCTSTRRHLRRNAFPQLDIGAGGSRGFIGLAQAHNNLRAGVIECRGEGYELDIVAEHIPIGRRRVVTPRNGRRRQVFTIGNGDDAAFRRQLLRVQEDPGTHCMIEPSYTFFSVASANDFQIPGRLHGRGGYHRTHHEKPDVRKKSLGCAHVRTDPRHPLRIGRHRRVSRIQFGHLQTDWGPMGVAKKSSVVEPRERIYIETAHVTVRVNDFQVFFPGAVTGRDCGYRC